MRYVKLVSQTDPEMGELGLKLAGMGSIDYPSMATEGLLIAHDILEHQQGASKIGTIGDELIALGGVWYVRGQHADIRRDGVGSMYGPEENVASDVTNMGRMYLQGCKLHIKIPKRRPYCDAEEGVREIVRFAARDIPREMDGEEYDRHRLAKYLKFSFWLMLKGYNMAKRRFERCNHSRYAANSQFWAIAEAVDPHCKHLDHEGQEFRLCYGDGEARCWEIHDDEWY